MPRGRPDILCAQDHICTIFTPRRQAFLNCFDTSIPRSIACKRARMSIGMRLCPEKTIFTRACLSNRVQRVREGRKKEPPRCAGAAQEEEPIIDTWEAAGWRASRHPGHRLPKWVCRFFSNWAIRRTRQRPVSLSIFYTTRTNVSIGYHRDRLEVGTYIRAEIFHFVHNHVPRRKLVEYSGK